ncbi:MAG: tRNA preQ1(34) S-adenosylmethionine ribosyltransferase-isomerase QueA [Ardenticatenaceae bacterium]|nr:tRNA preQ1(34) S-adenosylmethionine ribosyltransferase-isomerase QueA [Ardenticatenaceae bacterium]
MLHLDQFNYHLPEERIAQKPLASRDQSRLLVLERESGQISHKQFTDILDFFKAGDVLVTNNSRVIPARLYGQKASGGRVELLLLEAVKPGCWEALVGGRRLREGSEITIHDQNNQPTSIKGTITAVLDGPLRQIQFNAPNEDWLEELGHVPLPPYIHRRLEDNERYQTVYAQQAGSAAAPTAGLHFTPDMLLALRDKGVILENVTLHIGLDTFKPVETEQIENHPIHTEWARLSAAAAERINRAKLAGGRLVAVGTTSVRTLESAALRAAGVEGSLKTISQRDASGETAAMCPWKPVVAFEGRTDLFIYPGYRFRAVDVMITNFHMPKSTLMMLVSAFAGRENILRAYQAALEEQYRFLSLGDAMLIV